VKLEQWSMAEPNTRFRAGALLERLARIEKTQSGAKLDVWETEFVAEMLRGFLDAENS